MMTCYVRMRTRKCDVNFLEKFQEDLRSYKLVWWANEWVELMLSLTAFNS